MSYTFLFLQMGDQLRGYDHNTGTYEMVGYDHLKRHIGATLRAFPEDIYWDKQYQLKRGDAIHQEDVDEFAKWIGDQNRPSFGKYFKREMDPIDRSKGMTEQEMLRESQKSMETEQSFWDLAKGGSIPRNYMDKGISEIRRAGRWKTLYPEVSGPREIKKRDELQRRSSKHRSLKDFPSISEGTNGTGPYGGYLGFPVAGDWHGPQKHFDDDDEPIRYEHPGHHYEYDPTQPTGHMRTDKYNVPGRGYYEEGDEDEEEMKQYLRETGQTEEDLRKYFN